MSHLTTKDFKQFAIAMAAPNPLVAVCELLATTNPKFDRNKWLQAVASYKQNQPNQGESQ